MLRLQRAVGNRATRRLVQLCRDGHACAQCAAGDASPGAAAALPGAGRPLDPAVRRFAESGFGADFGDVRIHTDARAAESTRRLHALAYTVGRDIFFAAGHYRPGQREGRRLLAHELTHVLQQRGAAGPLLPAATTGASDERLERQADEQAARVLAGRTASPPPPARLQTVRVQRYEPPVPPPSDPTLLEVVACPVGMQTMLSIHLDHARAWVNEADRMLRAFSTAQASAEDARIVSRALVRNFHSSALADVGRLLPKFALLRNAMTGSPVFECVPMSECPRRDEKRYAHAYVRLGPELLGGVPGRVFLCPTWLGEPRFTARVMTLIHERAHQFVAPFDHAYQDEGRWNVLTFDQAIENADSYAVAVMEIALRRNAQLHRPSLRDVIQP